MKGDKEREIERKRKEGRVGKEEKAEGKRGIAEGSREQRTTRGCGGP